MRKRSIALIILMTVLIIFSVTISGCSSKAPSGTASTTPSTTTASSDVNSIKTILVNGRTPFSVSIDSISKHPGLIDNTNPDKNYPPYVIVHYTITNTGTKAESFFQVRGTITDYAGVDSRGTSGPEMQLIYPGDSQKGSSKIDASFREGSLERGMILSITTYNGFKPDDKAASWKIDYAKDVKYS